MPKGQNGTDKSLSGQVRKFVIFKLLLIGCVVPTS